MRAPQVEDPEVLLGIAVCKQVADVGRGAAVNATQADSLGGEKRGWRLALDQGVCAPRRGPGHGKVGDLVFAEATVAGSVLLIAQKDRAGGYGGGSVAPSTNSRVMASVMVARVAEGVAEIVDRIPLASKSGKCSVR